ncbi:HipA family kinase [Acinetobacter pullicarnis]|uniref:HipA family kinase n=1 Tax=Acinetobacter pullicarnis TaxID=2576829 RepID=UPI00111E838E|nr:HipA family kinase [Acinetobacter pullicarnis]
MDINTFLSENLLYGRALVDLRSSSKGSNPLWTGFVLTSKGEIPAYIKKCRNPDGLFIEIICSIIGLSLGLPIPKPIIVLVEPNHPQIAVAQPTFLYGSQMYDMPSFERFLVESQLGEECILEYTGLSSVIAFDELIANPDRNNSNILYDGETYRFIDHEKAFHPKQNPLSPISESNRIGNISDIVQHYKGENEVYIYKLMSKIKKVIQDDISTLSLNELLDASKAKDISQEYNLIIARINNFLISRHSVLATLIQDAITTPPESAQLNLLGG